MAMRMLFPRTILKYCLGILPPVALTACSSVHSTHIERNAACCTWKTTRLHGIPTKIKVPTHLQVTVFEKKYVKADGNNLQFVANENGEDLRTYRVETIFIEKEEIFTVDPVRPAAGLGYSSTSLNDKNAVSSIKGKIDDQTIEAINYSVNKLAGISGATAPNRTAVGTLPSPSTAKSANLAEPNATNTISDHETVIAVRWFDIYDPELQIQIHEFLRERINGCNAPCTPPTYVPNQPATPEIAPPPSPIKTK